MRALIELRAEYSAVSWFRLLFLFYMRRSSHLLALYKRSAPTIWPWPRLILCPTRLGAHSAWAELAMLWRSDRRQQRMGGLLGWSEGRGIAPRSDISKQNQIWQTTALISARCFIVSRRSSVVRLFGCSAVRLFGWPIRGCREQTALGGYYGRAKGGAAARVSYANRKYPRHVNIYCTMHELHTCQRVIRYCSCWQLLGIVGILQI